MYLYRELNKTGKTIDFYLLKIRNANAAKRFLGKARKSIPEYSYLTSINNGKNFAYEKVIKGIKKQSHLTETQILKNCWKYIILIYSNLFYINQITVY